MKTNQIWKAALLLLVVGVAASSQAMAGEAKVAAKPAIQDISLNQHGRMVGSLVDAQGRPISNKEVVVHQGRKEVAKAVTNTKGQFEVAGLKGGVYEVTSERGTSTYRVWTAEAAPKASRSTALVVAGQQTVRAQTGLEGLGGLGGVGGVVGVVGGVTGTVLGVNAENKADDSEAKANSLQQQLDQIQNSL